MTRALITGATAGIGAAFVDALAAEGSDVVLVARNVDRLEALAAQVRQRYGGAAAVLAADLSDQRACAEVEDRLADTANPIDMLINNAGFSVRGTFVTSAAEDEERMLAVNVRAVMRLAHAVLPGMLGRNRGDIINVSSIAGFVPSGGGASYAASKAWVTSFTESLSLNLRGTGVAVSAVCPGFTRTEFHQRLGTTRRVPAGFWLEAHDVVAIALADHRRGRVLSIPGGRYKAVAAAARLIPRTTLRWASSKMTDR